MHQCAPVCQCTGVEVCVLGVGVRLWVDVSVRVPMCASVCDCVCLSVSVCVCQGVCVPVCMHMLGACVRVCVYLSVGPWRDEHTIISGHRELTA